MTTSYGPTSHVPLKSRLGALFVLSIPLVAGPAAALHERAAEVEGQYILSLNLVAAGNFLANPERVLPEVADFFAPFEAAFLSQRPLDIGDNREEMLSALWRDPTWRALFIETAQRVWDGVLQRELLVNPVDTGPTSALLEIEGSALASPATVVRSPWLLATQADEDRVRPLVLQPNYRLSPTGKPNDPLFPAQWALDKTKVPSAWDVTMGSRAVLVAVIDSGYDEDQVELKRNRWSGNTKTNFGPGLGFCAENKNLKPPEPCDPTDLEDETGHGTAMAGIVGAHTNEELRVAGTNWSVSLMILKVLGKDNRGSVWDVANAIRFAADNGARIISLSLGGRPQDQKARGELMGAIVYASGRNQPGQASQSLVVVSSGNENSSLDDPTKAELLLFPASFKVTHPCQPAGWCFENLLVVGATDRSDKRASFSNHGVKVVDLGAPGVEVLSTGLEENWGVAEVTGTSASTAFVAGAAALVDAARGTPCDPTNELCFTLIKTQLLKGADRICELQACFEGDRRLNVDNAVRNAAGLMPTCKPKIKC